MLNPTLETTHPPNDVWCFPGADLSDHFLTGNQKDHASHVFCSSSFFFGGVAYFDQRCLWGRPNRHLTPGTPQARYLSICLRVLRIFPLVVKGVNFTAGNMFFVSSGLGQMEESNPDHQLGEPENGVKRCVFQLGSSQKQKCHRTLGFGLCLRRHSRQPDRSTSKMVPSNSPVLEASMVRVSFVAPLPHPEAPTRGILGPIYPPGVFSTPKHPGVSNGGVGSIESSGSLWAKPCGGHRSIPQAPEVLGLGEGSDPRVRGAER